jgi:dihydroorotate dehydrogenase
MTTAPAYDRQRSYQWNYDHAPYSPPIAPRQHAIPGDWTFCHMPVPSPLGVPAGPLLNGRWCLYYAALGFDVVTYKTVRSSSRACYDLPNLQPVRCGQIDHTFDEVATSEQMQGSWAVSFGMPSQPPSVWRADVAWTRRRLPADKLLVVSVVGTDRVGWTLHDLAADYARCAAWACESGADCIEANLSCPNVSSIDGQLYQQPAAARRVAQTIRDSIGSKPLILKIGHVAHLQQAIDLLEAVEPFVDALAMTNSIAATVRSRGNQKLFAGQRRGICGKATLDASLEQVAMFSDLIRRKHLPLDVIGVGGASSRDDVRAYLAAGANAVHMATAPMVDLLVARRIRACF